MASERGPALEIRVRPARPGDLPALLRIERDAFPVPWSERAFRMVLRRDPGAILVAERSGRVAGYAALWVSADEAELADLAVAPEERRRGVGSTLLQACLREAAARGAREIFLQVRESNQAARGLYGEAGFREVGRRPRYYRAPPEDALVLSRPTLPDPR